MSAVPAPGPGFALERRLRRAGRAIAYLGAGLPVAVLAALAVLGLVIGAALSLVLVGVPLLLGAAAAARRIASADRILANRLLGTGIPPLPAGTRTTGDPWRRAIATLSDRTLWRAVGVLAVKPLLALALIIVALVPIVLFAELLLLGIQAVTGTGDLDFVGPWSFTTGLGLVLLILAAATAVLSLATLDGLFTVLCTVSKALLAPRAPTEGPVRELLAESLGDRSVSMAYWLPDREVFVDETGRPVEMPEPGSGRAWTAVERDGTRVAAIIHDASLDTSRQLVSAAATASLLAIDNERLKADLRARLEELRLSRLRIVEAADEARRRLERDLHDGAQQQLVALSLQVRLLRGRVKDDPDLVTLVDGFSEALQAALADLRELARGIHPVILVERGLQPAIRALADRTPIPVDIEVPEERLPKSVEAAAYFLAAEALTNVAKYAHATEATITVRRQDGDVLVEVRDDGVGGVDLTLGSGLRGLQDRVAAVDGSLQIDSPPGGGTRLSARIPLDEEH